MRNVKNKGWLIFDSQTVVLRSFSRKVNFSQISWDNPQAMVLHQPELLDIVNLEWIPSKGLSTNILFCYDAYWAIRLSVEDGTLPEYSPLLLQSFRTDFSSWFHDFKFPIAECLNLPKHCLILSRWRQKHNCPFFCKLQKRNLTSRKQIIAPMMLLYFKTGWIKMEFMFCPNKVLDKHSLQWKLFKLEINRNWKKK